MEERFSEEREEEEEGSGSPRNILIEFKQFLIRIVPSLSHGDERNLVCKLGHYDVESCLLSFLFSQDVPVLFVNHHWKDDSDAEDGAHESQIFSFNTNMSFPRAVRCSVAFIKTESFVHLGSPFQEQIQIVTIPSGNSSAVDVIRKHLQQFIKPLLISSFSQNVAMPRNSDDLSTLQQKFVDLEECLEKNDEKPKVPRINLLIHPLIEMNSNMDATEFDDGLVDKLDPNLMNDLHQIVNHWLIGVNKFTKLAKDFKGNSLTEEIDFWKNFVRELSHLESQIASSQVELSLNILQRKGRNQPVNEFKNNSELKETRHLVNTYGNVILDMPVQNFLCCIEIKTYSRSISSLFNYLGDKFLEKAYSEYIILSNEEKKIHLSSNFDPSTRFIYLTELIAKEFFACIKNFITSLNILHLPLKEFLQVISDITSVSKYFQSELIMFKKKLNNVLHIFSSRHVLELENIQKK